MTDIDTGAITSTDVSELHPLRCLSLALPVEMALRRGPAPPSLPPPPLHTPPTPSLSSTAIGRVLVKPSAANGVLMNKKHLFHIPDFNGSKTNKNMGLSLFLILMGRFNMLSLVEMCAVPTPGQENTKSDQNRQSPVVQLHVGVYWPLLRRLFKVSCGRCHVRDLADRWWSLCLCVCRHVSLFENNLRYTVDCSTLRLLLAFSKAVLFGESESFWGGVDCRGCL